MRTLLTRSVTLLAVLTLVAAGSTSAVAASGNRYVQITTSGDHTCALTARGQAYCWGSQGSYNGDFVMVPAGALGDGTLNNSLENGPQAVIGGLKFASISAGQDHTCALTTKGRAYCWGANGGANGDGRLGDGTTTASGVNGPQAVIGGLKFVSISAGDLFTCAVTARGKAYCWGANGGADGDGRLGDGTTTASGVNGPQAVIGGLKFVSISAGDDHACALTAHGEAYCWGANSQGELGDGTTNDSYENGPQKVIGNHTFASLNVSRDGGHNFTCALTVNGEAYCWGDNEDGQLGDGTTNDSHENGPQAVIGGLRFASINPGESHTCALTAKGRAYCWGYNVDGQLGDGTTNDSDENGPQAVIGGLKFASVRGGESHTCALTARGKAYCWGYNNDGQLGDGTTDASDEKGPQAVQ